MWQNKVFEIGSTKVVVTLPIDDIEEHDEPGFMCACKPKLIEEADHWDHIVHNSFDGREKKEPIEV